MRDAVWSQRPRWGPRGTRYNPANRSLRSSHWFCRGHGPRPGIAGINPNAIAITATARRRIPNGAVSIPEIQEGNSPSNRKEPAWPASL